ncbi:MAG TPA: hypothetical protein DEV97_01400 [Lachnospiraceae bacterium]|nr:hypothetical protein [Lachnospiraceae bacterium]
MLPGSAFAARVGEWYSRKPSSDVLILTHKDKTMRYICQFCETFTLTVILKNSIMKRIDNFLQRRKV